MRQAEEAAHKFQEADKLARRRPVDFCKTILNPLEAERKFAEAEALLEVDPASLVGSPSTEMVSGVEPDQQWTSVRGCLLDTLSEPTSVSIAASERRAGAAARAKNDNPPGDVESESERAA